MVKLGYAGVYLLFLFLIQNIDCGYSLDCTHNLCFRAKIRKISIFSAEIFIFHNFKTLCIVFVMVRHKVLVYCNTNT